MYVYIYIIFVWVFWISFCFSANWQKGWKKEHFFKFLDVFLEFPTKLFPEQWIGPCLFGGPEGVCLEIESIVHICFQPSEPFSKRTFEFSSLLNCNGVFFWGGCLRTGYSKIHLCSSSNFEFKWWLWYILFSDRPISMMDWLKLQCLMS